jgi:glutathione S-transferase
VIAQLGKVFGFYPDEKDEFNGMQIVLSIADMHSDGRAPFHPVALMGSYYDQIEEAKVAVAAFVAPGGRLSVWLAHFNHLVETANAKSGNSGYLLSGRMTYVDIAMCHVLQAIASQFPEAWEQSPHTALKDYMAGIAAFPPIAAYQKSSRCRPFEGNSMM